MKINNVAQLDHINFTVNNFEESTQWYKKVFGFELVENGIRKNTRWGILKSGSTMLAIYERPEKALHHDEKYHHIYHFALRLKNKDEWEEVVKKYQLKIEYGEPIKYPHSTSWYIQDPTGHEIEVVIWDNDIIKFNS